MGKWLTRLLVLTSASTFFAHTAAAVCDTAVEGPITVTIAADKQVKLGKFNRPDIGTSNISVAPNGVRSLPAELNINTQNQNSFGDVFQAATAVINGGANCAFRIDIESVPANISSVTLNPGAGYTLSSTISGAVGAIDNSLIASGTFTFTIGATASVNSTPTDPFPRTFIVRVTYQ